eukprot:NODE_6962_length_480_cov_37.584687_g6159_i0.p2 GENE.NODE_6962_length_480_cov_37.584687_g6159_i0~~NODE_6962_length_480_cov_37.584687_g6159_i0.p2  ORF type:complete len:127 (+),score=12.84 NODE_6962_length_480_cov_37.584687_g6159_i0:22-381(+)
MGHQQRGNSSRVKAIWFWEVYHGRYKLPETDVICGKRCPECDKPVVHYHSHGCHHIGIPGNKCCSHQWCYHCKEPWPCGRCPLFCQEKCSCPYCPECMPFKPCNMCSGCPRCRPPEQET